MQNNENKVHFTFGWLVTEILTRNKRRNKYACLNNASNIFWLKTFKYSVLKVYKSVFHFTSSVRSKKRNDFGGDQVRHLLCLSRNGGWKSRLSGFHRNWNWFLLFKKNLCLVTSNFLKISSSVIATFQMKT